MRLHLRFYLYNDKIIYNRILNKKEYFSAFVYKALKNFIVNFKWLFYNIDSLYNKEAVFMKTDFRVSLCFIGLFLLIGVLNVSTPLQVFGAKNEDRKITAWEKEETDIPRQDSFALSQKDKKYLRVASTDDSFIIKRQDGTYYGYGADYLKRISEYTGWEYEFIECSFTAACQMLANGEIDLVCTMQKTPEREAVYEFSQYPCGWEYSSLYVAEDSDIEYEEFEYFKGLDIGFLKNFESNSEFKRYAKEHEFTYTPYFYETIEEMEEAFHSGIINAMTKTNLRDNSNGRTVAKYAVAPIYFAFSKQQSALVKELDQAVRQIKLTDPYYENTLEEKYYSNSEVRGLFLTRQEQKFIEQAGTFVVTYTDGLEPIAYEQDGTLHGISEEIFHFISEETGLQFTFLPAESVSQAWEWVAKGQADILACMENREINIEGIEFTLPYFAVPMAIISIDSTAVLKPEPVVAVRGEEAGLDNYLIHNFPELTILHFNTAQECFDAVLKGIADFAVENMYLSEQFLKQKDLERMEISQVLEYETEICAGIYQGINPLLLQILNRAIATVSSGEKIQMAARALISKETNLTLSQYLSQYKEEAAIVLLLLISLTLAGIGVLRHKKQLELERFAYFDRLTGFHNGEKFKLDLKKILEENKAEHGAVVYFDINRFRYLNSVLGVSFSNDVICSLANKIDVFLQPEEFFGRVYADNFLAFCYCETQEELVVRLKQLHAEFQAEMEKKNSFYKISLFTGVYLLSDRNENVTELIYRATLARQSCRQGNPIMFFDGRMEAHMKQEVEIESIMEEALKQDEFQVYYQPKYAIKDEQIVGAEALVRWQRPDGRLIYPDNFIPLFEKNGFIIPLDYYVYEKVLRWLSRRKKLGLPLVKVSVNLSRLHSEDTHLAEHLAELAKDYGVEPDWVEFELTESALTEDSANLLEQIRKLRSKSFTISIDDFGAGYSSLNLLRNVSADMIKIDKGFLDESGDSIRSSQIIKGILVMAKDINMEVICEGVETKEQLDFLREAHCDYVQGYYFARPMCIEDFEQRLIREGIA